MDSGTFYEICLQRCLIEPDKPVLAAFSGGADSLSLVILLKKAGFPVVAAHFNHHLRIEAEQDEQNAANLANKLGIKFISGFGDVPDFVRMHKLSVEEGARQLRYGWLFEQAVELKAQALAVGHTADDQVETVIMHLLRGSGLDGLTGMPYRQVLSVWNSDIPIIRPLLDTWRTETEEICRQEDLLPVQDASNQSSLYFRNRIRLELIPSLQSYNAQAKAHILQTAKILTEEQSILETVKREAWDTCLPEQNINWISLDRNILLGHPEGLRRSILRMSLLKLSPDIRDIDFELTEKMSRFALLPTRSGEMHLVSRFWLQITNNRLLIWDGKPGLATFFPQLDDSSSHSFDLPGKLTFDDWQIEVQVSNLEDIYEAIHPGKLRTHVQIDLEKLQLPLVVRSPQPGERFHPLGMKGRSQKLSDYFINQKIPRQARKKWPLVVSGQSIVWVVGLGISEEVSITTYTTRIAQISLHVPVRQPAG